MGHAGEYSEPVLDNRWFRWLRPSCRQNVRNSVFRLSNSRLGIASYLSDATAC